MQEITSRSERHTAKILIRNGISAEFYTYAASYTPLVLLDFGRIAEALYDVKHGLTMQDDIEITISSEVPVGVEVMAARVPIWLAVNITSTGLTYEQEEFDNIVIDVAKKILLTVTDGIGYMATIDVGPRRYTIVEEA